MPQPIITQQAVQAALIPADTSPATAAAIQTCTQGILSVLNTASASGVPVGILMGCLVMNAFVTLDTLRVVVEQTHPDGTPVDSTADALTAMEQAVEAQLAVVKQAQVAHTAQATPPAQG